VYTQSTYTGRVEIGGMYPGPLSWSVHHNFVREIAKEGGHEPQSSPVWANFSITMECMQENGRCHSVYSVSAHVSGVASVFYGALQSTQSIGIP
jgi:hypothetical protein